MFYSKITNDIPPFRNKIGDAGIDMYVTKDTWIFPFKVSKIHLNFKCELPIGKFGFLTSRSGTSLDGIFVIPGIIDSGFRGQLSAITTRIGLLPKKIKKGTRIAQLIILDYTEPNLEYKRELSESDRGAKGFGSSGIN